MIRKWPEECELNYPIIIFMLRLKRRKKEVTNIYHPTNTIALLLPTITEDCFLLSTILVADTAIRFKDLQVFTLEIFFSAVHNLTVKSALNSMQCLKNYKKF